ncbi:MAG TPA: FAD-dependent oxidoreductase [Atopostipes sp.]|nr:FAD-dependent oxidoreductase [Atopostipes sp.]
MKVLIVGGVAGGMSAATRLRRLNEKAEIVVFDKGPYVSFANCGLPYHVSGIIEDRESLLVQTPEALYNRFRIDVRPHSEVVAINAEEMTITVEGADGTYEESYDKLILSLGAEPIIPPIKGYDEAENVFTLRNIPDLDAIMANLNTTQPKEAIVVGGGFIGLEMVENLVERGLNVTLVEKAPQILTPLDEEMAIFVENELLKNNVKIIKGESAVEFQNAGKKVILENGEVLNSDLTILSIGVKPATEIVGEAGIELGIRGGILVDDRYETSIEDIYAVGDAILVKQQITGEDALISLASPANRQGRQVADIIAGYDRLNRGSIGTSIVRVFDISAASTGLNERQVKAAGFDYAVTHTSAKHHAGYYPGAKMIELKVIFDAKTGELYGAQAVGEKGIDKRIDIIATAIKGNLTVYDLPELEFTYAPPFGSAKDPVNMAGYQGINLLEGFTDTIQWYELEDKMAQGWKLLDVRSEAEVKSGGYIEGSIIIPLNDLRDRLDEIDPAEKYIVSCHSGQRSYIAERILKQHNFNVKNLDGAFHLYKMIKPEAVKHD